VETFPEQYSACLQAKLTTLCIQSCADVNPNIFRNPIRIEHFKKSWQFIALTRAATYTIVHDAVIEPWISTFAVSMWRCEFRYEGALLLAAVQELNHAGLRLPKRMVAAGVALRKRGIMPVNFTMGGLIDPITEVTAMKAKDSEGSEQRQRGLPPWLEKTAWRRTKAAQDNDFEASEDLPPEVAEAVWAYRKALRIVPPAWAALPLQSAPSSAQLDLVGLSALELKQNMHHMKWPFPHCNNCSAGSGAWRMWHQKKQRWIISRFIPRSPTWRMRLVSEEMSWGTALAFYNLTGDDWQTGGDLTHVNWADKQMAGHPGDYSLDSLLHEPEGLRKV
jgi:hypothetical protein